MAGGGSGPTGSDHNSPAIDPGTLSRSTSPSTQVLGWDVPAGPSGRRHGLSQSATASKGYVIVDNEVKRLLPNQTWESARTRVNDLFRKAGGLVTVYIWKRDELPRLNLTDGLVECHLNSTQASYSFRFNVYNQLNALGHTIPSLMASAKKFNQPDHYSVDAGRSYTVKWVFQVPPRTSKIVCITHGVISVTRAFSVWAGLIEKRTKTTLATIRNARQEEQLSLGIVLGNLIAHELRHQLALSQTGAGLGHSGTGLGMDGADFRDPKTRFSDEDTIRENLVKLRSAQLKYERR